MGDGLLHILYCYIHPTEQTRYSTPLLTFVLTHFYSAQLSSSYTSPSHCQPGLRRDHPPFKTQTQTQQLTPRSTPRSRVELHGETQSIQYSLLKSHNQQAHTYHTLDPSTLASTVAPRLSNFRHITVASETSKHTIHDINNNVHSSHTHTLCNSICPRQMRYLLYPISLSHSVSRTGSTLT